MAFSVMEEDKTGFFLKKKCEEYLRSQKPITTESREDLFNDTLEFMIYKKILLESDVLQDFNNQVNPIEEIETYLRKLSSYETEYFIKSDQLKVLKLTFMATAILAQGREALDLLADVDVYNKRISYYESNRNGSMDNLIEHFSNILEGKNENRISHPFARREVAFKRTLTRMKKKFPEYMSFILLNFIDNRDKDFFEKILIQGEIKEVVDDIMNFFEVGHATPDMIYKSIAIQIFELYRNIIPIQELKEIINLLIYYSFNKDYKNFKDFGKKQNYLKNVVGKFAVFDFDDEKGIRRRRRMGKIFEQKIQDVLQQSGISPLELFFQPMHSDPLKFRLSQLEKKYFVF